MCVSLVAATDLCARSCAVSRTAVYSAAVAVQHRVLSRGGTEWYVPGPVQTIATMCVFDARVLRGCMWMSLRCRPATVLLQWL